MMRRETAYKLAGRKHHHEDAAEAQFCQHLIRFSSSDFSMSERAGTLLARVPGVEILGIRPDALRVRYSLAAHSLEELEGLLAEAGFTLNASLMERLLRGFTHFCEETRLRNMRSPQRLIKQSNAVYIEAWKHHPHGDHDDTPADLRADR